MARVWIIEGAMEGTGVERQLIIKAPDAVQAERRAVRDGMLVSRVRERVWETRENNLEAAAQWVGIIARIIETLGYVGVFLVIGFGVFLAEGGGILLIILYVPGLLAVFVPISALLHLAAQIGHAIHRIDHRGEN